MGVNGHTVQFRPALYRPVASLVRDYHPVEWDLGNDSAFEPRFPFARNGVDWSQVYGGWRREQWRIDVSLMFESISRTNWRNLELDPQRYGERFARAFGPSGANALVQSVEIGNEPGRFSDSDYRKLFESMARGLRAGDSNLCIVTCALTTGKSHEYAKSVECIAGLESLYDVLNVHSYAELEGWPTWRRSFPEDPALKAYLPDINRLCAWRDAHAAGKAVWLTEFGYDASDREPDLKSEFKSWKGVSAEEQAQWVVRSWLVFASLPIQRVYVFFFNDEDSPQVHGASGLTRHYEPRPVFYAVAQLQRVLGDYHFNRVVVNRPGEAAVYEFTHGTDPSRLVWVAWSPTGAGRTARIELPSDEGIIEKAERMTLSGGNAASEVIDSKARVVEVRESPLYLWIKRAAQ